MATRSLFVFTLLAAVFLAPPAARAESSGPAELGLVRLEVPGVEGALEPGVPVANHELVKTQSQAAIVHLDNGEVLRFAENSSALLDGDSNGEIRMKVLSGTVTKLSAAGRIVTGGSGSVIVLRPVTRDRLAAESVLMDAGKARPKPRTREVTARGGESPR